jgi:hypothetical protein
MSSPTPGSDPNYPQGGAPQGQPEWGAAPPPPQGYNPAPSYSAAPAGYGAVNQRPGMVTAAGIIGIVWGALGLLFGLLALAVLFAFGALLGLLALVSVALSAALLWAGIQVIQNKSPRLLLLISYVAIGINILTMIIGLTQGASIFSYLLGFILPGVIVFLLMQPQSKQYYASQGISY